jgi:hypothetical protein
MKRTVTSLCVAAALAVAPAVGYACSGDGGSASASAGVSSAKNAAKLKKCKQKAYSRYQGPDLNKALKKCKKKYG